MNKIKHSKFVVNWSAFLTDEVESIIDVALHMVNLDSTYGKKCYPNSNLVFRAFAECPENKVNVVLLGQDPYFIKGAAIGKCFDNNINDKASPSLANILLEINTEYPDRDILNTSSYLEHLPSQGVLMLNTALTVLEDKPESHLKIWQDFTREVFKYLDKKDNIVWVLCGAKALSYKELITNPTHKFVISSHPSPLGARQTMRGYPAFIGSKPFSKVNEFLKEMGKSSIKW
jgi:uracil-DNA glycosylase